MMTSQERKPREPSEIAGKLSELRRSRPSLTQKSLAAALGVDQSTVSRWARGTEPSEIDRERILDRLRQIERSPNTLPATTTLGLEPEVNAKSVRRLKRLVRDIRSVDREAADLGSCFTLLVDMVNLPASADPGSSRQRLISGLQRRLKKARRRTHLVSVAALLQTRLDQLIEGSPC